MKPVFMTRFGHNRGDCLTACIASLLECEISDLPNFSDMDKKWLTGTREWLESQGFGCLWVAHEDLNKVIVSDCLCVAVIKTSTEDHACIVRWKTVIDTDEWHYQVVEEHDPNNRITVDKGELRGVFLVFPSPNTIKWQPRFGLHNCGAYHDLDQCPTGSLVSA